jgi:hypothetical protein
MAIECATELEVAAFRSPPPSRRQAPGVVWLGGYRSDMLGTKAETLDRWARRDRPRLHCATTIRATANPAAISPTARSRHGWRRASPYSALHHGSADPRRLVDGRLDRAAHGGRSCAWAGEGDRVAGLVLIAPAPDFTAELIEPR